MRVLVTGCRGFSDRELLYDVLDRLHATRRFTDLIHGDANGADRLASEWGAARGVTGEVNGHSGRHRRSL